MSFYDDASLIMYPSGYKANKIYSLKPTDGSGDFDFTRASTATRVNADGLIESVASGVPRIDYTGGGCGKLLLEPQRTNLLTYSEDFSDASWIKLDSNYSNNTINAGPGTAFKGLSKNESTQGVQSLYFDVEYIDHQYLQIGLGTGGTDFGFINFDIQNKVLGTQSGAVVGSIVDYGSFLRIIANINTTSKTSIFLIFVDNIDSTRAAFSSSVGSFKVYRSQLELGSYPTSYIPTAGATATRVADAFSLANLQSNGILPQLNEGTLFFDLEVSGRRDSTAGFRHIRLADNSDSTSNRIRIYEGNNGVTSYIRVDLTADVIEEGFSANVENKLAVTWGVDGTKLFINGSLISSTATRLDFASNPQLLTSIVSNYNFNQILLFPTPLTDQELINLTTI